MVESDRRRLQARWAGGKVEWVGLESRMVERDRLRLKARWASGIVQESARWVSREARLPGSRSRCMGGQEAVRCVSWEI